LAWGSTSHANTSVIVSGLHSDVRGVYEVMAMKDHQTASTHSGRRGANDWFRVGYWSELKQTSRYSQPIFYDSE
jgi:hypothetical protein